ncbi:metal ABC transporter solute-binding protein, Zn/Mn family [Psychromonas sp. KJ10-10]|uniref:metal ABC transporter solute-binding protein, Zn/Mn family n=1 Tax=Psychromonas sp. KJ10-10 TaxID=3391823 RepID=UPI0039B3DA5D
MSPSIFKKTKLLVSVALSLGISSTVFAEDKLTVVTSFSILGDLVSQVGGEHIDINTLVKKNTDAHVFTPTPKDALSVKNAKLLVMNGLDFEGWMPRFLESAHFSGTTVIASNGIKVIDANESEEHHDEHEGHEGHDHEEHEGHDHKEHEGHDHEEHEGHDHEEHEGHDHEEHEGHDHEEHEGHDHEEHEGHDHEEHEGHDHEEHEGHDHEEHEGHDHEEHDEHAEHNHGPIDPHAWHSIDNVKIYIHNIEKGLSKVDPSNSAEYKHNANIYLQKLEQLEVELQAQIKTIPLAKRKVITPHDAFAYLSRDFNIKFIAPQGTSTESEPSASDLATIITQIRKEDISAVFMENITDNRIIEQISRETDAKIGGKLFSGALSDANGPAPSYITMMQHNVMTIVKALTR